MLAALQHPTQALAAYRRAVSLAAGRGVLLLCRTTWPRRRSSFTRAPLRGVRDGPRLGARPLVQVGQPRDRAEQAVRVLEELSRPVSVDGDVVPGRHHLLVLQLRRGPRGG
jgi:hypothetical protein